MRKVWFAPSIVANGILWLVGLAMQIGGWANDTIAFLLLGIAFLWSIATYLHWRRERARVRNQEQVVQERIEPIAVGASRKEKNASVLEDIKSDLVAMNTYEREAAVKKAKQPCDKKTAIQIYEDFCALFDMNLATFAQSLIEKVIMNHDIDSLIDFFKTIGDILDANDYGLKTELENDEPYKLARLDLTQKRLVLRESEKKKTRIQKNIDRSCSLGYGLNSCILLRGILNSTPELREQIPAIVRVTLEGIETATETTLNAMMNDLEGKLKATISQTQIQGVIDKADKMQSDIRLGQSGEMQDEHTNN